jgi:hypothetical protein
MAIFRPTESLARTLHNGQIHPQNAPQGDFRGMSIIGLLGEALKRWDQHNQGNSDDLDERIAASVALADPRVHRQARLELEEIIRAAWTVGRSIDLSNAVYGPAHWKDGAQFSDVTFPYYSFLAGLVRHQNCLRIFEIGSHYGGSCLSMLQGADSDQIKVVTIDITDLNPALHTVAGITKLVGDANSEALIKQSLLTVDDEPIDLLYVDADHRFLPTITGVALYSLLLKPRFVVIDDIALNPGMRTMWNVIRAACGGAAIDCVDVIPEIRARECGFGLVKLR